MEVSKNLDNTELFPFILGVLKSACKGLQTLLGNFGRNSCWDIFFSPESIWCSLPAFGRDVKIFYGNLRLTPPKQTHSNSE